jgi:hypothetical protein
MGAAGGFPLMKPPELARNAGLCTRSSINASAEPRAMSLKTFFEKFALLADAPAAVAKMRELVLKLAAPPAAAKCSLPANRMLLCRYQVVRLQGRSRNSNAQKIRSKYFPNLKKPA